MHIMSATVVTPDSAISAPRSSVPTSAISRVTHGSSGPVTCMNHSHSVWVSPIPDTSASLKCPWQLTKPGTRIPVPSPTTGAAGYVARSAANGPTATIRVPATATRRRAPRPPVRR